jgi:hypothetical protein
VPAEEKGNEAVARETHTELSIVAEYRKESELNLGANCREDLFWR